MFYCAFVTYIPFLKTRLLKISTSSDGTQAQISRCRRAHCASIAMMPVTVVRSRGYRTLSASFRRQLSRARSICARQPVASGQHCSQLRVGIAVCCIVMKRTIKPLRQSPTTRFHVTVGLGAVGSRDEIYARSLALILAADKGPVAVMPRKGECRGQRDLVLSCQPKYSERMWTAPYEVWP